jgi:multiple sugar transport system ATP-binding protein
MAALAIENLTKSFVQDTVALDQLNLNVPQGELMVVVGPSGSGKTTILRLIAGLESPTCGRILLDGSPIEQLPPQARNVSMAFQSPALLPQLTVGQNIALGAKLRKISDADGRVQQAAKLLEIKDLLGRRPETLSGGQQQRVSLARALVLRPSVLLLDEPLASLDPLARAELRQVIRSVQKELGVTTIYVTHDQSEAAAVADRIAVLQGGRLQQTGTALELYRDPANLFVAQFIGPNGINVFSGDVLKQDQITWLRIESLTNAFPVAGTLRAGPVICGIRPSAMKIDSSGELSAVASEVLSTGWSCSVLLKLGSHVIRTELPAETEIRAGRSLRFRLDSQQMFFFEPISGVRIEIAPDQSIWRTGSDG